MTFWLVSVTSAYSDYADSNRGILVHNRREFEIEDGTQAIVQTTPEGILVKPITGKHIRSLRGKYKHLDLMKGLTDSRKEDRQRDW